MTRSPISDLFSFALLGLAIALLPSAAHAQTFSLLYNFGSGFLDPWNPTYPGIMAQGSDGVLYTTSSRGGNYPQEGAVFKITPSGRLTLLYSFGGTFVFDEGEGPAGGLTLGTDGNFYGTTSGGGTYNEGIVFKITPGGTLTKLYDFTGGSDGGNPMAAPIQGTDGNFYGTTLAAGANHYGTVYKITASGIFTTIHSFAFGEGNAPFDPLVQGMDGNFYGTTTGGGAYGNTGTVFKVAPSGKLTTLYSFDGVHGTSPYAPLIQGSDGNFLSCRRLCRRRVHFFRSCPGHRRQLLWSSKWRRNSRRLRDNIQNHFDRHVLRPLRLRPHHRSQSGYAYAAHQWSSIRRD